MLRLTPIQAPGKYGEIPSRARRCIRTMCDAYELLQSHHCTLVWEGGERRHTQFESQKTFLYQRTQLG